MKLLFTGGGGAGNEAIYRLWNDRYDLQFADADADAFSPEISPERCHQIPLATAANFSEALAKLCLDIGIDLLIPGVDAELPKLIDIQSLAPDLKMLAPSADYIDISLDKWTLNQKLSALGLPCPQSVTADSTKRLSFPVVAKPRQGTGSRGVQILNRQEDVPAYVQLSGRPSTDIILQERIVGDEYTVMMAADGASELQAIVPVKVTLKRGITLRAVVDNNPAVINGCKAIHEKLSARGCYNIQLILQKNGQVMPFEINPRISTTFCLGIAAGVDPVAIFLGTADASQKHASDGVVISRSWRNEFSEIQ